MKKKLISSKNGGANSYIKFLISGRTFRSTAVYYG